MLLFLPSRLVSFPDEERTSSSLTEPPIDVVSFQASSMVLDGEQFLFLSQGESLKRVDLETWSLASEQVPALTDKSDETGGEDLRGDIGGLAVREDFLFASQVDGDLLVIDLDGVTEDPDSVDLGSSSFGSVAADTETGTADDKLYLADRTLNAIAVYDISDGKIVQTISLRDSLGGAVTPQALVWTAFPTVSSTDSTDKIYVTSNRGLVFVIQEGAASVSKTITLKATNVDLPALALTPEKNFLLVVNQSESVVHVINTATDEEVDTDSSAAGVNPISLTPNSSLKGIAVLDVTDPSDTYAYVSGSGGVSVIDLDLGVSSFSGFSVLDFDDEGAGDTEDDPMPFSVIPGPIIASSETEARLYTSNSDASISIISDAPFVTIRSTSLGESSLSTGGSFTLTFQADEAGSYSVRVGGDLSQTGTEVTTGTVSSADADVTTDSIAYSSSLFSEGTNRIFVFVTDSEGNIGRDAVDIAVDTPPDAVVITETGFGNGRAYLIFERSELSDISLYRIYVEPDTDGDGVCSDEAIDTTTTIAATVSQTSQGETLTAQISGLINGQPYCLGVEAVDNGGNVGPRTTNLSGGAPALATPEVTVGITGRAGEAGCSLLP